MDIYCGCQQDKGSFAVVERGIAWLFIHIIDPVRKHMLSISQKFTVEFLFVSRVPRL